MSDIVKLNREELAAQALRLSRDPTLGAQMAANASKFFAEHSSGQERVRFYDVVGIATRV